MISKGNARFQTAFIFLLLPFFPHFTNLFFGPYYREIPNGVIFYRVDF